MSDYVMISKIIMFTIIYGLIVLDWLGETQID